MADDLEHLVVEARRKLLATDGLLLEDLYYGSLRLQAM